MLLGEGSHCCSLKQTHPLHNRHSFQWIKAWPDPWLTPHPFLFSTLLLTSFVTHSPILSSPCLSDLMHIVVCLAKTSSRFRFSDLFFTVWFQPSENLHGSPVWKTGEEKWRWGVQCSVHLWPCPEPLRQPWDAPENSQFTVWRSPALISDASFCGRLSLWLPWRMVCFSCQAFLILRHPGSTTANLTPSNYKVVCWGHSERWGGCRTSFWMLVLFAGCYLIY